MQSTHITPNDLRNLGVELSDEELAKLANELSEKVDDRVGTEIIAALTPEDAQTLAGMDGKASDDEMAEWIVLHVPDYQEIIDDHRDIVLGDFAETSDLVPDNL
jgi:hypothetical protein